jgi:hypothetical protein
MRAGGRSRPGLELSACEAGSDPPYAEEELGERVAEFRLETFSGYRYRKGGWP